MPEYLRVLDTDTGHKSSIQRSQLAHGNYKVLADEDAVDVAGDPLPPVFAQSPSPGEEAKPYAKWSNAELEDEVDRRNDARGEDETYVVVESPANKAQLVAALEADDLAHPQTPNQS